jgi:putative spermidine/putrescine transport system permease protein
VTGRVLVGGAAALVLLFLVSPMLAILPLSFSDSEILRLPPGGWSLRWYERLFTSDRWLLAARNSVVVAVATTLLGTVLGTLAALGLHFGRIPGRSAILALLAMPVVTPSVVTAAALFLAYSPLGLTGTMAGLVLGHTIISVPFVVLAVLASLRGFDATLLRAAASLGATPAQAFRRVVLPLIAPGVAAGAVFAFATSFDEFILTLFLAGPGQFTLPRQIYAAVRDVWDPTICAAAVVLFLASMFLLLASEAARKRGGGLG